MEGDPRVVPRVAGLEAASFGMPLVVFAELLFGVEKSARREANRARLERFAAGVRMLPFDLPLATRYSTVRAALERKGRPKTQFDIVVACTALEHGATLITNDGGLKDGAIDGLLVEDWLEATI